MKIKSTSLSTSKSTTNQPAINQRSTTSKELKNCKNEKKENNINTSAKERKPAQDTIEQRAEAFKIEVFTFQEKYPVTMLDGFFSYWTEPTPSKTKMRFELEKTWEMSRRLVTWASRAQSGPRSVPPAAINNRAIPAAYLQKLWDPV